MKGCRETWELASGHLTAQLGVDSATTGWEKRRSLIWKQLWPLLAAGLIIWHLRVWSSTWRETWPLRASWSVSLLIRLETNDVFAGTGSLTGLTWYDISHPECFLLSTQGQQKQEIRNGVQRKLAILPKGLGGIDMKKERKWKPQRLVAPWEKGGLEQGVSA